MRFVKDNKTITISTVKPDKKKGLYITDGKLRWKVASFISDISADEFEKYLEDFIHGEGEVSHE